MRLPPVQPQEPTKVDQKRFPKDFRLREKEEEPEEESWNSQFSRFKEELLPSLQTALKNNASELVVPVPVCVPVPDLSSSSSLSPVQGINPQILDLIDLMVGSVALVDAAGISETTITLDSPGFAGSLFYGAEITVREYSTAPKAFNIHFSAGADAIALFNTHASDLMAAFQNDHSAFKLNRLETHLLENHRPFFKRKERVSEDKKGNDHP
jgi:hypothetical protein